MSYIHLPCKVTLFQAVAQKDGPNKGRPYISCNACSRKNKQIKEMGGRPAYMKTFAWTDKPIDHQFFQAIASGPGPGPAPTTVTGPGIAVPLSIKRSLSPTPLMQQQQPQQKRQKTLLGANDINAQDLKQIVEKCFDGGILRLLSTFQEKVVKRLQAIEHKLDLLALPPEQTAQGPPQDQDKDESNNNNNLDELNF